jgi:hypothetical protein
MADEQEISASEQKKEDWMNSKWRPMMGWMYMLVCTMDFVGFPVMWSLLQMVSHGNVSSQWQPLTLQGAGLFHIAMGAVIGISAYGRTQEKLGGAAGPTMQFPAGAGTSYTPSAPSGGFGNGATATPTTGFSSGASAFGAPATGGFGSTSGFGASTPATGFGGSSSTGTAASGFGGSGFGSAPATAPAVSGATSTGFGSANPAPPTPPTTQLATAPSLASRPVL